MARSSGRWLNGRGSRTHPLAIAPTNTAIECVSGKVGRNWDNRIVGASADSAVCQRLGLNPEEGEIGGNV